MKALVKGPKHYRNDTFPLVHEYFARRMLTELGISGGETTGTLPYRKYEAFQVIHDQLKELEAEQHEKARKRAGRR